MRRKMMETNNIKKVIKRKKLKVVGFWIEPTNDNEEVMQAIEKIASGVILAKKSFANSNKCMFQECSEAVAFSDLVGRDIKESDVKTLYLVRV